MNTMNLKFVQSDALNWLAVCIVSAVAMLAFQTSSLWAVEPNEPTHREVDPIKISLGENGKIETMAMDRNGVLLLGVSWSSNANQPSAAPSRNRREPSRGNGDNPLLHENEVREYAIRLLSSDGADIATWPTDGVRPSMIHACADGQVYVAGSGQLLRLSAEGRTISKIRFADLLDGEYRKAHASGVTANEQYFFIAFGQGFSMRATEDIVRLNRDLTTPKLLIKQQFGCCSHIDLDVKADVLFVAENSRHRVNRYTLDGAKLDTWGRRDRTSIEGFAACCNPVNIDWGPEGELYTAESGIGRVKRYSPDGEYLGLVGYVDTTKFDNGSMLAAMSCYIPVEVANDSKRIYVMDVRANFIRVLERTN
jgi:hypothetical protein